MYQSGSECNHHEPLISSTHCANSRVVLDPRHVSSRALFSSLRLTCEQIITHSEANIHALIHCPWLFCTARGRQP